MAKEYGGEVITQSIESFSIFKFKASESDKISKLPILSCSKYEFDKKDLTVSIYRGNTFSNNCW
jgi:hypothetical protein